MVRFEDVCKAYWYRSQPKHVARHLTGIIPDGAKMAILGRNGAGKSTLLSMIAGNVNPDHGRIRVTGEMSWPIGLTGCIQNDLTGAQNVRFIARVYGVDTEQLVDFVREFAELGPNYEEPVKTYSSGMRGRLNFGMSMGIRFDTYLLDEVHSTGDGAFRRKADELFRDRMSHAGIIMVSHSDGLIRELCTSAAVLEDGYLTFYDNVEEALEANARNLKQAPPSHRAA